METADVSHMKFVINFLNELALKSNVTVKLACIECSLFALILICILHMHLGYIYIYLFNSIIYWLRYKYLHIWRLSYVMQALFNQ